MAGPPARSGHSVPRPRFGETTFVAFSSRYPESSVDDSSCLQQTPYDALLPLHYIYVDIIL